MITAADAYERAVTLTSPETQEIINRAEVLIEQAYGKELTATSIYFTDEASDSIVKAMSVLKMRGFKVNLRPKIGQAGMFDHAIVAWGPQ